LSVNSAGAITPNTSTAGTYNVIYTIPALNGCSVVTVSTPVTIVDAPTASISYPGSPFCTSLTASQTVTFNGMSGGTYSAPAGLPINPTSGAITPSGCTAGSYTVTYITPFVQGCGAFTATATVTITELPTATISYPAPLFCTSLTDAQGVKLEGSGGYSGGTYSFAPAGLNLSGTTITPNGSNQGDYTVTYTIPSSGGCAAVVATYKVTISNAPAATISYNSPYCTNITATQTINFKGTNGGTFNGVPSGLLLNGSGDILPGSQAGIYTVTYSISPENGCSAVNETATVTVTQMPSTTISYANSPFCTTVTAATPIFLGGTGSYTNGTYSSSTLTVVGSSGAINPSISTAGAHIVTYTIPVSGGCAASQVTTELTITALPTATISYANTQICTSDGVQSADLDGTGVFSGGSYNCLDVNLDIDASGKITPKNSKAGTYTIIYTTPVTTDGCSVVTATATVTITELPTATIAYDGTLFCTS
jgi:hypothetical protein